MHISNEEYRDILAKDTILSFGSDLAKNIFLFYQDKKAQHEFYTVDYDGPIEYDTKLEYRKFGIDLGGLSATISERYYILILEESDLKAIRRKSEDFVEAYLPTGVNPTHFIINAKLSYEQMELYTKEIHSLYPDCISFTDDIQHRERKLELERKSELDIKLAHFPKMDIEPYLKPLLGLTWPYTESFLNLMHDAIERIRQNIQPGQILYYGGSFSNSRDKNKFIYLAVHLQYYYGIKTYIPSGYEQSYMNLYSSLMFNPNTLLVEDVVAYIKNLPNVLSRVVDYGPYIFIVDDKSSSIFVKYCSLDGISTENIKAKPLNVLTANIVPLGDMYNLRSELTAEQDHKDLLDIIIQFEKKLGITDKFLNVTNVFFFEENGTLNIGYMENINFSAQAFVMPLIVGRPPFYKSIELNDLQTLYPLDIFIDSKAYIAKTKVILTKLGNPNTDSITTQIHKHPYEYGAMLSTFRIFKSADLKLPYLDFLTIGLHHLHCSVLRQGLYSILLEEMTLRGIRDNSSAISAFGGFHPLLDNALIIDEKLFTGGTIDV